MDFENQNAVSTENNMSDDVIKICNLTKRYGSKKAVNNASFSVKRGEIMGFLGPNGAGKSTTMNILTGYLSATEGSAMIGVIDVLENPKAAKAKIGYLPENPPLYLDMTVREYLEFVYELKKVKLNMEEHINSVMEIVKITQVSDRIIKNLSKGYKQRVGLAQALIGDPEVLVLDEPTVGLDPKQIVEIRNVIKTLGESRTIILSTHILQEVSAVCDRVTVINNGRIVAADTLKNLSVSIGERGKYEVCAEGQPAKVRALLETIDGVKGITPVTSESDNESSFVMEFENGKDLRREVFEAFAKAEIPMIGLKSMELTLEEIFLKLTNTPDEVEEIETEEKGFLENIKSKFQSFKGGQPIIEINEEEEAEDNESDI